MPAEFQVISERVCIIKYTEPVLELHMDTSAAELTAYAERASRPIIVIGDYSQIARISPSLIHIGLRPGSANPLRNPAVGKIIVIAQLAIIKQLASIVSRVLGIQKMVVVQSQEQADKEVEMFLQQYNAL